jgi:hypothetical protein
MVLDAVGVGLSVYVVPCHENSTQSNPVTVEVVGFMGRAVSAHQKAGCWTRGPYLVQTMFILLAPALFAASVYMSLGRIIEIVDGERHAIIGRRWLTKIFVIGDVICFLLLAGGEFARRQDIAFIFSYFHLTPL